ncbi:MAG: hypothetical protein KAH32_03050 [Chlamydiia bacterium]|nr:hypothetical protein [Chlamydiia bacterium]
MSVSIVKNSIVPYSEEDYLLTEESASRGVYIRLSYIDMCHGDFNSALVMSQIRSWHLPDKKGGSKLRVEKNGILWIAKKREDWFAEIRLTARQVDRSLKVLVELGFIEKQVFKFDGEPVVHVRALLEIIRLTELALILPEGNPLLTSAVISKLPSAVISKLPSEVITKLPSAVISLTETTTKNTTENKEKAKTKVFPNSDPKVKEKDFTEKEKSEEKSPHKPPLKIPSKPKPKVGGVKEPTKSIKNKSTSVKDMKQNCEDMVLKETISSIVIDHRKNNTSATGSNLGKFWVRCMIAKYPQAGYVPTMVLSATQCSALLHTTKLYKRESYDTLGMVLDNWESFTQHAKNKVGAFGLPEEPTVDFVSKWKMAVLSFKLLKHGGSSSVESPTNENELVEKKKTIKKAAKHNCT